jgi:hypothetical protein
MTAEQQLAEADRHIAEAEVHILRQRTLIEQLVADGHDTAEAEAVLATLLASLEALRAHRATILAEVPAGQEDRGGSS